MCVWFSLSVMACNVYSVCCQSGVGPLRGRVLACSALGCLLSAYMLLCFASCLAFVLGFFSRGEVGQTVWMGSYVETCTSRYFASLGTVSTGTCT